MSCSSGSTVPRDSASPASVPLPPAPPWSSGRAVLRVPSRGSRALPRDSPSAPCTPSAAPEERCIRFALVDRGAALLRAVPPSAREPTLDLFRIQATTACLGPASWLRSAKCFAPILALVSAPGAKPSPPRLAGRRSSSGELRPPSVPGTLASPSWTDGGQGAWIGARIAKLVDNRVSVVIARPVL